MQYIITHPENQRFLRSITDSIKEEYDRFGMQTIHKSINSFPVIYSERMQKNKMTGYKRKSEKFVEYGTSDWEIYFGFCDPVYEPYFVIHENGR